MPEPIRRLNSESTNWLGRVLLTIFLGALLALGIAVFTGDFPSTTISSLSTIVLVAVTGVYAYLTWKLVTETRQARKDENAPVIVLQVNSLGPKIVNVGNGTAVNFHAVLRLEPADKNRVSQENQPSLSIRKEYIPDGEEIWITDRPFVNVPDGNSSVHSTYETLSIDANYYDVLGNSFTREMEYPLDDLRSDELPEKPPLQDIANQLASINTTLEKAERTIEQDSK